jgi:hypothetical protein
MATKRNRIIYPSQSVWANGNLLYRVSSFGSTTTFTSEDLFELGQLDKIDVVDDVPTVAVTLETNCFGDIYTLAYMANVDASVFNATATATSNIAVVSGSSDVGYYHGIGLADFAKGACGEDHAVDIWSPVQEECSIGTAADNIDMTMFLGSVFINRVEWSFTSGANATENYTGETDNKMWLLNDGRFVSAEMWQFQNGGASVGGGVSGGTGITCAVTTTQFGLCLASGTDQVVVLSDGTYGFLRTDDYGRRAVKFYNASEGTSSDYPVISGTTNVLNSWAYNPATNDLFMPTNFATGTDTQYSLGEAVATGDKLYIIVAADAYASDLLTPQSPAVKATQLNSEYFAPISTLSAGMSDADRRSEDVGAIRQGQIEAYLVDPDNTSSYSAALRLTGVTISTDLTRTPLNQLGSLLPYDRPVTLPIPFTVTVDTTATDLETWAIFSGKLTEFNTDTLDDIDIYDILSKDNMMLVIKVYQQTDQEAGGTASNRKVLTTDLVGDEYFLNTGVANPHYSTKGTYVLNGTEYPLETIVCKGLKITDEGYTVRVGDNATQTFGFKGTNDIYAIMGEVAFADLLQSPGIQRN